MGVVGGTASATHATVDDPLPGTPGAVLSTTVIVCDAVAEFKHASVAVHVRVILYSEAHGPGVITSVKVRLGLESHRSDAVGVLNTGVAGHSIVPGPPTPVITGAVVSSTLMIWL